MADRILMVLVLLLTPAAAVAQSIHGVVVEEESGETIGGAEVRLVAADGRTAATGRADRSGVFLLRLRQPGEFTLRVTHPSYATAESELLTVAAYESLSVELRLAPAAIPLEPLIVTARADSRGAGGMYERMRRPTLAGQYVTREDIDRRKGARATDLLRGMSGVYLYPAGSGGSLGHYIQMRGYRTSAGHATPGGPVVHGVTDRCEPTIYVDGIRMHQWDPLDGFLRANILEGVEVYSRGYAAPPPLLALDACGVVAFWTRQDVTHGFGWKRPAVWLGLLSGAFLLSRL